MAALAAQEHHRCHRLAHHCCLAHRCHLSCGSSSPSLSSVPAAALAAQEHHLLDINIVVVYLLHYISIKRTTVDIHSTIVPSVACQTTEGKDLLLTILLPTNTL